MAEPRAVSVLFSSSEPAVGAVFAWFRGSAVLRWLGMATLAASLGLISAGLVVTFWVPNYVGPSPLYFEICLWPFYCLFFSVLVCAVLERLLGWVRNFFLGSIAWRFSLGLLALPFVCLLWSSVSKNAHLDYRLDYPLRESPLVQTLRAEVGWSRVAPSGAAWPPLPGTRTSPLESTSSIRSIRMGSPLLAQGTIIAPWGYGTTGFRLSTNTTSSWRPAYYAAMTRLLSRPTDRQLRTVIVLTRPELGYLRSLGIRYLLTDYLESAWVTGNGAGGQPGLRLIQSLPIPQTTSSLHVCELTDPNLGSYSPTRVRLVSTAQESLDLLQEPGFDFHSEALVTELLPETLVPASSVHLTMHAGHVRIEASSSDTSLLLLPLQYSHCLELEPQPKGWLRMPVSFA